MLLAIDVGNTQTTYGLWDNGAFEAIWRRDTNVEDTEDQLAAWLFSMFQLQKLDFCCSGVVIASVVPQLNSSLVRLATKYFRLTPKWLEGGDSVGLKVDYDPPQAVGADRLANALGALNRVEPPVVVVDFGTATTFDVVDKQGTYVGGAIMPGLHVATQALIGRTAKLPMVSFEAPSRVIGKSTPESLQSGIVLGYAGSIDTLVMRIREELGGSARVLATGGLSELFVGVCESIDEAIPQLTLEGLVIAYHRLQSSVT